jgi:putative restriction endonuclease
MTNPEVLLALDALQAADFVSALTELNLHKHDLEMLQTHYHAPERTISASQMARALGFKTFGGANLQYGNLAKRVGEKLGFEPETSLFVLATFDWPAGECEWIMRQQVAEALETLGWVAGFGCGWPEEVSGEDCLREGAVFRVSVNAYERSPVARKRCIEHYGASCFICGFNFGRVYGEVVDGLIHVHHLRTLSEIGEEYTVDPVADLRPVCPNFHAVLHSRTPAYSIEEVRALLNQMACNRVGSQLT